MKITDIQTIFNNAINESPWWQRFKGSEFVRYLVTFVAMVVERVNFASERRLQESFLTRAISASSVLAGAESRGYIPRKRIPNKKGLLFANKTGNEITVPAMTKLFCPDNGLTYLLQSAVVIPANGSAFAACIQVAISSLIYQQPTATPFATVLLSPDTSDQVSDFRVFVTEPLGVKQEWARTKLFRHTDGNSQVFVEYYTPNEQIGIRFGNGVSGRIVPAQSTIEIECLLTEGATDVPAGVSLVSLSWPELAQLVDIQTGETLQLGTERESIESIRQNALYYPSFDEQIVWGSDHLYYIKTNVLGLNWISVWGEAEQEKIAGYHSIEFINTIYISAHHPSLSDSDIQAAIQALYAAQNPYNERYQWVAPVHKPFTVIVKGKTMTTNTIDEVSAAVKAALKPLSDKAGQLLTVPTPDNLYHLVRSTGLLTQFDIQVRDADLMAAPKPNEFRYLNIEHSIFQISF